MGRRRRCGQPATRFRRPPCSIHSPCAKRVLRARGRGRRWAKARGPCRAPGNVCYRTSGFFYTFATAWGHINAPSNAPIRSRGRGGPVLRPFCVEPAISAESASVCRHDDPRPFSAIVDFAAGFKPTGSRGGVQLPRAHVLRLAVFFKPGAAPRGVQRGVQTMVGAARSRLRSGRAHHGGAIGRFI